MVPRFLPDLGYGYAQAWAFNDLDQIVGRSNLPDTLPADAHATLWQNGKITDLGSLTGGPSVARAINNSGQIVGTSHSDSSNGSAAVIWQHGSIIDISNGFESFASDINEGGSIVGQYHENETVKAFIREGSALVDLNTRLTSPLPNGLLLQDAVDINDIGEILVDAGPCSFLLKPANAIAVNTNGGADPQSASADR